MKSRIIGVILVLSILLLCCTGCSDVVVSMPYSTAEYIEMNWPVEELVAHFKELGFSRIKLDNYETFDENEARITCVNIEDFFSDSLFTDYKKFEKGEDYSTLLEIHISAYSLVPTLTVDNCSDFAEIVTMDSDSPEKAERIAAFMKEHNGEYLEFDGTITYWYDGLFWISVSMSVAVEDSDEMNFSWSTRHFSDLCLEGYDINMYHEGLITEGMKVHIITKIEYTDEGWTLKNNSVQIIE